MEQKAAILKAAEVRAILAQVFIGGVFVADRDYSCITRATLFDELCPWYKEQLAKYGVFKWEDTHDCDDFARSFPVFAQFAYRQKTMIKGQGVAIGECWFNRPEGGHAINFAIIENKDVIFIEPQLGRIYAGGGDPRLSYMVKI